VGATFRYDQIFDFDVARDVLWDALNDTDRYPQWWPWLRSFDAAGLVPGTVASCAVRGPLPYTLEFDVHVEHVDAGRSIDTRVSGDLSGPARLEVSGSGAASTAQLSWAVELTMPVLSAASFVARPVLVWAHDRVVATGVEQFREHALTRSRGRD
jgi:carbon monoxide dehydrogenase subunit G